MLPIIGLTVAILAFLTSLVFNGLQHKWRREERAQRERDKVENKAEQRSKEQAPPMFYNYDGNPGPIIVSGKSHSAQCPMMDLYCLVTVVNPTQVPVKIVPHRLVLDGEEWLVNEFFFRVKDGETRERLNRITLRGNDKEDYELHFMFSDDKYPHSQPRYGELWLSSDNRGELFPVSIKFS